MCMCLGSDNGNYFLGTLPLLLCVFEMDMAVRKQEAKHIPVPKPRDVSGP